MTFRRKIIASLVIGSGVLGLSGQAFANDSEELEKLRALVQELDQKIRVLDRKSELAEEAAAAKKKETPVVKASEKGFGLQSADGQHEIKLRGLIHADYRGFQDGTFIQPQSAPAANNPGYLTTAESQDAWLLRRIRPTIEGTVFGRYDFRFTPEFGEDKTTSNSGIVDAYIDARFTPEIQLRVGKFKPYVGLERLQSGADIKFIERSYVTNALLPNRDLGASLHGDLFGGKLNYALGIYNGVVDGGDAKTSSDTNSDKDYAARIFATPFKDDVGVLSGLGFGLAGTYGDVRGKIRDSAGVSITELTSGYKSEGQQTIFRYNDSSVLVSGATTSNANNPGVDWLVHADGRRYRFAPQANYYYGPLGVLGEYAFVSEEVSIGRQRDRKTTFNHDAWEVAASYLLTGEDASFKGVKPKRDFDPDKGGWGAWELVARYSELNLDDDVYTAGTTPNAKGTAANIATTAHWLYADPAFSSKSAHTWTAGVNWYLNPEVKFSLNYAHTTFDGGGGINTSSGAANQQANNLKNVNAAIRDRDDENALLARFQIAF